MFEAWQEATLQIWGFVPRGHYIQVLEENARLRRRLAELEGGETEATRAASDLHDAFSQMLDAQREWMEAWLPEDSKKDEG